MNGILKKAVSMALCAVMTVSLFSVSGFAAKKGNDDKAEEGEGISVIFSCDFENRSVGEKATDDPSSGFAASSAVTELARMIIEQEDNGNKVVTASNGEENTPEAKVRYPRIDKGVSLAGINNLTIDCDIKSSGGETKMNIYLVNAAENQAYVTFTPEPGKANKWNHVKVRCDMKKKEAKLFVDGDLQKTVTFDITETKNFCVRFNAAVALDKSTVSIDNIKITTPDDVEGIVGFDGHSVNWSKVKVSDSEKTGLTDVMRKSHPRIFLTDWQKIKDKAASDENAAGWYSTIIKHGESMLTMEPTKYDRNVRGNINDCSSSFKYNVIPLAAAYCLTGDKRFKDRVYKELEAVGNWPDWGSDAYLCTAHILLAYGLCYDWIYNDWTESERANILGWIRDKGLNEAVLAYEHVIDDFWAVAESNWNNVCNGSNLIAAIAVADEMPDAAEYIFKNAASGIPHMFKELSKDGAYSEPMNYWDYGIRHLVKTMSALDTCVDDGKKVPDCLDFSKIDGIDNTSDFPIYYNGTTAAFNYGDAESTIVNSSILFYLANKYNKPQYAKYAINTANNNKNAPTVSARDAVLSLLWYEKNSGDSEFPLDKFYHSSEPFGANGISIRSSWDTQNAMVVMAHAGDATAPHSSLDAGGFVLDWAGKRWVHMYGREPVKVEGSVYSWPNYHTKVESGGHYDYYHCRAEANNTIIANPKINMPDMDINYFAKLEKYESGKNSAFGIIDMTSTNKDFSSAKRGIMLDKNRSRLVVKDEITAKTPSEFYWFVNTRADITISEDKKSALWEMDGERMLVRIANGPELAGFEIMPSSPLPTSPNPEVQGSIGEHKMVIQIGARVDSLDLAVEFVPLKDGEGIPECEPIKALSEWKADNGEKPISQSLSGIVALKVNNPNAYAKGEKTFVDTTNHDIMPIIQNDRTLVPVRFISENMGAGVDWNQNTKTVTIKTKSRTVSLVLGSDIMTVNGENVTLDVAAQEIGGRTLIPLRALSEALGKQVFWDDRGLIIISDDKVNYDANTIDRIIDLLDIRVFADGREIEFFDSEKYDYFINLKSGENIPSISVLSDKASEVSGQNPAVISIGGKEYRFSFKNDLFENCIGTGSEGVVKELDVTVKNDVVLPSYQTFTDIKSASSSIDWSEKYPMTGTYDGVINDETKNRWSANGTGNWVAYDLGEVKNIHSVAIAGYKALSREYKFEIAVSDDGSNYKTVIAEAQTTLESDRNVFKLGDVSARYVKITGNYSSNSTWVGISEVRFYESEQMENDDQAAWNAYFYNASVNAKVGSSAQLIVKGMSKSGAPADIDASKITYTSANSEIATVSQSGEIKLVGIGKTTVTVSYDVMGIPIISIIEVNAE